MSHQLTDVNGPTRAVSSLGQTLVPLGPVCMTNFIAFPPATFYETKVALVASVTDGFSECRQHKALE